MSFHVVYHCPLHCCSHFIFLFANPVVKLQEEFQYLKMGEKKKKKKKKKKNEFFSGKTPGQCAIHISLKIPFSLKPFHISVIDMWSCYVKDLFSMIFIFFWDEENLTVGSYHIYNTIIFSVQFPWTENLQISKVIYCK